MALIHCNFHSHVLGVASALTALIPESRPGPANERRLYPALYLLHGLSDDHTIWQRRTSIERYVNGMNLAVIMPAVNRSFYADMAQGYRYWTFISEELPAIAQGLFPISTKRQDTFAAGISMGGYGAFKLAFNYPERFGAAASLSGVLDLAGFIRQNGDLTRQNEFKLIFGNVTDIANTPHDLCFLARAFAGKADRLPRLYQCCGTEDYLYRGNCHFRDLARGLNLPLTYAEGPGQHGWDFWDRWIQRVLQWLPVQAK